MNHGQFLLLNAYQTMQRSIQYGRVFDRRSFGNFPADELPVCQDRTITWQDVISQNFLLNPASWLQLQVALFLASKSEWCHSVEKLTTNGMNILIFIFVMELLFVTLEKIFFIDILSMAFSSAKVFYPWTILRVSKSSCNSCFFFYIRTDLWATYWFLLRFWNKSPEGILKVSYITLMPAWVHDQSSYIGLSGPSWFLLKKVERNCSRLPAASYAS